MPIVRCKDCQRLFGIVDARLATEGQKGAAKRILQKNIVQGDFLKMYGDKPQYQLSMLDGM